MVSKNKNVKQPSRATKIEQAITGILQAKRCHRVGRSLMLVLPKAFIEIYGLRIEGTNKDGEPEDHYYVRVDQDGPRLIITPIQQEDIDGLPQMYVKEDSDGQAS